MKKKRYSNDVLVLLCIIIFSQRIAINFSGIQISIGLIVLYVFIIWWALRKELYVSKKRLLAFSLVLCGIFISVWASSNYSQLFSIQSLILLIGIYFITIFTLKPNRQSQALQGFQKIMLIIAWIGIFQFLTQLLGIPYRDWLNFIPEKYIIAGYQYSIPLARGHNIYKSNGIFLAEPSFYSQFLALSIIIEIYYIRRYVRLLILMPAFLLSFSGTGILLLAAGFIPFVITLRLKKLIIPGAILITVVGVLFSTNFLSYITQRISELQRPTASGYIRFVSPYVAYGQLLDQESDAVLFGLGPGVGEDYNWNTGTYLNPPMKLLIEYGLMGLLFFIYIAYIFFTRHPSWLAFSLFVMYTFLSGGLLTPQFFVSYFPLLFLWKSQSNSRRKVSKEEPQAVETSFC